MFYTANVAWPASRIGVPPPRIIVQNERQEADPAKALILLLLCSIAEFDVSVWNLEASFARNGAPNAHDLAGARDLVR